MNRDVEKASKELSQELEGQIEAAEDIRRTAAPEVVEEELRRELRQEIKACLERTVKAREAERRALEPARPKDEEEFVRFSLLVRLQHMALMSSCFILILTGLPMKFPESRFAHFFSVVGGVSASGIIRRIGATMLIFVGVFHLCYIAFLKEGRREFQELLPKLKDVQDVLQNIRYFLGITKHGARFDRFSYIEKFDYWAVYWGMVVMIASGLMLWRQDLAMAIFPKFFLDMAREAHSDEALLATLAIIIWHFYNVHLNPDSFPTNRTWLTDKLSKERMMMHHHLIRSSTRG